jgi:hypothetical protein
MTRGREGFQQEMFKTQIHEERRQNAEDTSAGGLKDRVFGGD